jgi:hypothetical protein
MVVVVSVIDADVTEAVTRTEDSATPLIPVIDVDVLVDIELELQCVVIKAHCSCAVL